MLLDAIVIFLIFIGLVINLFGKIMGSLGLDLSFIPFDVISYMFPIVAILLIRYRGFVSTYWKGLDFPTPGTYLGHMTAGSRLYLETLYPSIENYLKTKKDEYYKDIHDGTYNAGGHNARLIDVNTAHTGTPERAQLTSKAKKEGFSNYEEVVNFIKKEMMFLKDDQGHFLLTGSENMLPLSQIDIKKNLAHKKLFEDLSEGYYINNVRGESYSFKHYNQFQDKLATPTQIGSIIHYVKSSSALKAAKVRSKTPGGLWKIALVGAAILFIVFLVLMLTGGKIPGLI